MYYRGSEVADHVRGMTDADAQVQPAGVDLTVAEVFRPSEEAVGKLTQDRKEIADRKRVAPVGESDMYQLDRGAYIVVYGEELAIPEDAVGYVYPRSSLMRNFSMLHTAVWDPGYEGRGEALLEVNHPIEIEQGARIAQIVLCDAESDSQYTGSYHEERLDK